MLSGSSGTPPGVRVASPTAEPSRGGRSARAARVVHEEHASPRPIQHHHRDRRRVDHLAERRRAGAREWASRTRTRSPWVATTTRPRRCRRAMHRRPPRRRACASAKDSPPGNRRSTASVASRPTASSARRPRASASSRRRRPSRPGPRGSRRRAGRCAAAEGLDGLAAPLEWARVDRRQLHGRRTGRRLLGLRASPVVELDARRLAVQRRAGLLGEPVADQEDDGHRPAGSVAPPARRDLERGPAPSSLETPTVPPWFSVTCLTMASPSPVPPVSRDRARSTR